jgi:hypothetical protein
MAFSFARAASAALPAVVEQPEEDCLVPHGLTGNHVADDGLLLRSGV